MGLFLELARSDRHEVSDRIRSGACSQNRRTESPKPLHIPSGNERRDLDAAWCKGRRQSYLWIFLLELQCKLTSKNACQELSSPPVASLPFLACP